MANNTYSWSFPKLNVIPEQAGQTNVVVVVQWEFIGQASGSTSIAKIPGGTRLSPYVSGSFVPFESLTQEIVEGWVMDALPEGEYDKMVARIDANLEKLSEPVPESLPPPWVS